MRIVVLTLLFSIQILVSQVDTESLRKIDMKVGLNQNLLINIGLKEGNTEYFALSVGYRADYVTDSTHIYGVGNLSYQDNQNGVFQRAGFIHLRYLEKINQYFSKEAYVQKQFDYFQRLKDRNLIGGGARFSFDIKDSTKRLFYIFLGSGLMYENELLNIKKNYSTNIIRSSSYFNISWIPNNNFNISSVLYYQWDIFNSTDFRILNISSLNFKFNDYLSFVFSFNYRFDNHPPIKELKKYDYEFRNGVKLEF